MIGEMNMKYIKNSKGLFVLFSVAAIVLAIGCQPNKKPAAAGPASPKGYAEASKIVKELKMVKLETTKGDIIIELDDKAAPASTINFLQYVQDGFYDGTIFHRVIPGFMIQGGGHTADMQPKQTRKPIMNEAANGLKNVRGSVAMARTSNPNSATSQFFINLANNDYLNYAGPANPGYAVFGKVVKGMDVVDAIAQVKTGQRGSQSDVPVEPVVIKSAKVVSKK